MGERGREREVKEWERGAERVGERQGEQGHRGREGETVGTRVREAERVWGESQRDRDRGIERVREEIRETRERVQREGGRGEGERIEKDGERKRGNK